MSSFGHMPLHEAAGLKPGDLPVKPMTANEMRQAIHIAGHLGSPWIRRVMQIAENEGLNGEDRFVLLAFHMLLENERQAERSITELMVKP